MSGSQLVNVIVQPGHSVSIPGQPRSPLFNNDPGTALPGMAIALSATDATNFAALKFVMATSQPLT